VLDRFTAEGATYEQMKKIFKTNDIEVRTLAEIKTLVRPADGDS
jgi:hypothetical protein